MKSVLRHTSPADAERLRAFLARAFATDPASPFLAPAVMHWKYWEPRGDWDGARSFVLERDGAIVAHAGIYPMTFAAAHVSGAHMIDWASDAGSPGAGVALLQKLTAMFDFIYSAGGSELSRKVLPAFGFVECGRQWKGARPLQPFRQMTEHQYRNWKRLPRLARNLVWASHPRQRASALTWRYEPITPRDVGDAYAAERPETARFSPRAAAFFEYLQRCPVFDLRLFRMWHANRMRGHFALATVRGQARVAGLWLDDTDASSWTAAYELAQVAARELGDAREVVAAGTSGNGELAASAAGFHIVGHNPVYLLDRKRRFPIRPEFQFQLADNDGIFLDEGTFAYWT